MISDGMDYNCITIKNFNGPGCEYWPGMKLALGAIQLHEWLRFGFVKLWEAEPEPDIESEAEPEKPKRKRTMRATTAVTK